MENSYSFQSPIGFLTICEQDNQLTRLYLDNQDRGILQSRNFEYHSDFLHEVYHQLNEYFAGKRKIFDLPVDSKGTAFQKAVWRELQKIPYGETRSYEDIAVATGKWQKSYYDCCSMSQSYSQKWGYFRFCLWSRGKKISVEFRKREQHKPVIGKFIKGTIIIVEKNQ